MKVTYLHVTCSFVVVVVDIFKIMVIPNIFLLNNQEHHVIMVNCLCNMCKHLRLVEFEERNVSQEQMYNNFKNLLPHKEDRCLDRLFANTINMIISGKAYKKKCLDGTGYRYFKSWCKHEAQFAGLSEKELSRFCNKVNEACWVFDNWEKIVSNLTDERMFEIDARRLSMSQLYLAKNVEWCLALNDNLRRKNKRIGEPLYPREKFDNIFQNIIESGILEDIEHDPSTAASIGGRLQNAMISYCRRRYQPY